MHCICPCNVSTTSPDLPVIVPMFQLANFMQSGTLEVFCSPPPTALSAEHQVYDSHNDGNLIITGSRSMTLKIVFYFITSFDLISF